MSPEVCSPHRLSTLLRAGDVRGLDEVTRCLKDRLMRTGLKVCTNQEDAEDVVQDALLTAATRMDQYRGDGSVAAWLDRIVRTACYRRRRGLKNNALIHDNEVELIEGVSPEILVDRSEVAEKLQAALLHLPPQDRALIILSDLESWSSGEISEQTGLSRDAIRQRISRARRKLRGLLDDARPA